MSHIWSAIHITLIVPVCLFILPPCIGKYQSMQYPKTKIFIYKNFVDLNVSFPRIMFVDRITMCLTCAGVLCNLSAMASTSLSWTRFLLFVPPSDEYAWRRIPSFLQNFFNPESWQWGCHSTLTNTHYFRLTIEHLKRTWFTAGLMPPQLLKSSSKCRTV